MSAGARVAAAALELVGTPFRLHGREPARGLDCLGLAEVALRRAGLEATAPRGYRLRAAAIDTALGALARCDLAPAGPPVMPGDLLLVRPGPAQHHLLVAVARDRFVHAHAGLGRVVAMPGPLAWPVLRQWRPLAKD